MASARQTIVASLLRRYPFYSGCGSLANHGLVRKITGTSPEPVWAKVEGGEILASLDDYMGRSAYFVGDLDRKISWICKRLVRPGDTALDIGANIGVVTMLLGGLVGTAGRVHAFEPNPTVYERLSAAISRAGAPNVKAHPIALGKSAARLTLQVPAGNTGQGSLAPAVKRPRGLVTHEVEVRPLDDVLREEGIDTVHFLKIDVEGFEMSVLEGARSLFERQPPRAILFEENSPTAQTDENSVFGFLSRHSYAFFSIPRCLLRMHLCRFDPNHADSTPGHDFLAVPADRVDEVAARVGAE